MKLIKTLIILLTLLFSMSCNIDDSLKNIINPNTELYQITDDFVKSLQTKESYGFNGQEYIKYTNDSTYQIMPIGRLINVKLLKTVSDNEYETLKTDLKEHYKDSTHVNDVYICGGGTIMIDCRN